MTAKKLNQDIKKLSNELYRMSFEDMKVYFDYVEKTAKPEFIRLFHADDKFEYMNLTSIKIMLRLNVKHRFVAFHNFGALIEIKGDI